MELSALGNSVPRISLILLIAAIGKTSGISNTVQNISHTDDGSVKFSQGAFLLNSSISRQEPDDTSQILQETSMRQQNIRQSTLPMLILGLVSAAFVIAFKVFLLLWKVTYYTVYDPYETSGPVPDSRRKLGTYDALIGQITKALMTTFVEPRGKSSAKYFGF